MLQDKHQRRINYLRLSVTDRCNLRCRYCMPDDAVCTPRNPDLLTRDQLMQVAGAAVQLGIKKIRITGGEPLVRADIVELMADLTALTDLDRLVMTTNGVLLERLARPLAEAGVSGMNISIDSLDADRYRQVTRGGDLQRCLAGIEAALAAGLRTKLNVVLMAGVNDDELAGFLELARTRPVAVRFIEFMPTRGGGRDDLTVPSAEVLRRLADLADLRPLGRDDVLNLAGPARNFSVVGGQGSVGVISPVTCHFCQDCNRIRVTAEGLARGCLFHETGLDLKPYLRAGDAAGLLEALRRVVNDKPEGHTLAEADGDGPDQVDMWSIGG